MTKSGGPSLTVLKVGSYSSCLDYNCFQCVALFYLEGDILLMVLIRKLEEDEVVLYLLQPSQVPQPTCQAGTRICFSRIGCICFSPFFKKLHFPLNLFFFLFFAFSAKLGPYLWPLIRLKYNCWQTAICKRSAWTR